MLADGRPSGSDTVYMGSRQQSLASMGEQDPFEGEYKVGMKIS